MAVRHLKDYKTVKGHQSYPAWEIMWQTPHADVMKLLANDTHIIVYMKLLLLATIESYDIISCNSFMSVENVKFTVKFVLIISLAYIYIYNRFLRWRYSAIHRRNKIDFDLGCCLKNIDFI